MEIRSDVKKEVETLQKKYFAMDLETLLLQQKRLCPFLEELVRLALEYTQAMETAKLKKRIVDFADIEHFALRILVDEKTKQPRHTAEEFRRHFAEIMIDEYQDSNQVQEEIMRFPWSRKAGIICLWWEMSSRASIGSGLHAPNFLWINMHLFQRKRVCSRELICI